MPSTNETKVTTNESNTIGSSATETQERHWDFLHGCWKYGPRKFNGWISDIVVSYATAFL